MFKIVVWVFCYGGLIWFKLFVGGFAGWDLWFDDWKCLCFSFVVCLLVVVLFCCLFVFDSVVL